jgi:hypothetical protein
VQRQGILVWAVIDSRLAALENGTAGEKQNDLWRCISSTLWLDRFFDSHIGSCSSTSPL